MIHYHGTPITPIAALYEMAGRHFCVSHAAPSDVARVHMIGQSVMLDNGAFSKWKSGKETDWNAYYEWSDKWLDHPTTWAIIPDVVEADAEIQDELLKQWPHKDKGSPVWHMHEPISRLIKLTENYSKVCMGSSAEYAVVLSEPWCRRVDAAWNEISKKHKRLPWIHMLRGMSLSGKQYPFASVDSTDIARNHHLQHNTPRAMADRWDGTQCPSKWNLKAEQMELIK
jgi:hypothetical protein